MYRLSLCPTRDMNLNDLRIALITHLCATKSKTPLIVRMEDGDKAHSIEGKDQELLEMLSLFGIHYSQLYYQSENFKYHLQFASTFLDKKRAFICFCPPKEEVESYEGICEYLKGDEILDNPNPFVIRMKKPEHPLYLKEILKGDISFDPATIDSFIIMGQDKYPTPVFATACDDMLQGVSTIIRSNEVLLEAPRETYIRQAIGYDQALNYAHISPLHNAEMSVKSLLDEGFLPEAILNYLLSLDTNPPSKMFTLQEAQSWFDLNLFSGVAQKFEMDKLRLFNQEHIQHLDAMELSKRLGYACENIGKLAKVYANELSTTYELKMAIDAIFAKKEASLELVTLQALILQAPYFETFDAFKTSLLELSGFDEKTLLEQLRFWLTGSKDTVELALIYPLIKTYLKEIVR